LILVSANELTEAKARIEEALSLFKNDEWIIPLVRFYAGENKDDFGTISVLTQLAKATGISELTVT